MEGDKQEAIEKEVAKVTDVSLKELSRKLEEFALERDWMQFHSPRNLLLAVVLFSCSSLLIVIHICVSVFVCIPSEIFILFYFNQG